FGMEIIAFHPILIPFCLGVLRAIAGRKFHDIVVIKNAVKIQNAAYFKEKAQTDMHQTALG
ncbi:MAG TPA: hypothetical protein PKD70_15865, partial [Saprospiraceae bacterium]|nr:hypothetical protein [Saprospiraceae bacterium]HMP15354.1 hypothetical protein [Saprospiraceae bacterium]